MLTLVSKFTDGYLSGQRRSPESILHTRLPHCSPLGACFTTTKFRLNRLRRWPSSSLNPLTGFQNSACMLHAISLAAWFTAHSQLITSTSFFVTIFLRVVSSSGRKDRSIRVLVHTQFVVGSTESHFSVNSTPWWRLLLSSLLFLV